MRVLAAADLHIKGGAETEEVQALDKIAEIAEERNAHVVIVAGDVFEARSTPEQRLAFRDFIRSVNKEGGGPSIVILRGNHDEQGDLSIFHDPERRVYVHEQPGEERIYAQGFNYPLTIHTIPHFNAGGVALASETLDDYGETGSSCFDQILDGIFQKVRGDDSGCPHMVAFHGVVSGARLDNGMIPRMNGIVLNVDKLSVIGCPVVGGHYHQHQEVSPNVWYTGSPTRQTFGEAEGDKGVMLFETDGYTWSAPEFISLNPTPMILVEAEWSGDEWNAIKDTEQVLVPGIAGARVRFRYRVKQDYLSTVNLEPITTYYSYAKELKIERVVEITTAVRCEEIAKADTVEDSFRVWAEARNSEPEIIDSAIALLKHIMDPEIKKSTENMPEIIPENQGNLFQLPKEELAYAV